MKTFIILAALLAAGSMRGQSGPVDQQFHTATPKFTDQTIELQPALKPNEIKGLRSDITYSGVLVQAVKMDNPLQLINPLAPPAYGSGEQNLDRDIITQKPNGLKFFSIDF